MSAFAFQVEATCASARAGWLLTPHGRVPTPAFMPVASQASIKALTPQEARACGTHILICNAYHLALRPGAEVVRAFGGLHAFMGWDGPLFTDSGGFQVYSLGDLRRTTDEGILFQSHLDGSTRWLTPEEAIRIQEALGADAITCLDECLPYGASSDALRRAVERTQRWAERCVRARTRPDQALFAIVQGGHDLALRQASAQGLVSLDCEGYAVGGLSVGEDKALFLQIAQGTVAFLPAHKPRYLMGVGAPDDLVHCIGMGYDLFDCVLPTRTGRTGGIYTRQGRIDITAARWRLERGPLEEGCDCFTCTHFGAGYLHHLFRAQELLAFRLATVHNLRFYQRLMAQARQAIVEGRFPQWQRAFLDTYQPTDEEARLAQHQQRLRRQARSHEETWH
ncbi:MAG: tRNA guanosine(34) transglycosylase Tgt [Dehalococcoidia bacterium]|nr:tRNA guanosine(34) transglycosylase Tgt [Dehalococcoidia bacterium]MDW8119955.1 tRNA guanosine(34) transglycosylase Tgt [Chloroflexota bacterium]